MSAATAQPGLAHAVAQSRMMTDAETKRWRKLIERPRVVRHWGHDYEVTPRLLPYVFGDGGAWMALAPLNTRPNYYVIRVDSRLKLSSHAQQPTLIDSCLDDIYDALEEDFGCARDSEDEDDAPGEPWPALDLKYGSEWWPLNINVAGW